MADKSSAPSASTDTSASDAQAQTDREQAAAASLAPRMIADAAAALATESAKRDLTESPSIAEQAKAGNLPDPIELALKARGASGSGRRLDETIPGGLTVHPDGYFKNAKGEEVTAEGKVVEGGNQPKIDLSGARIEQL